MIFCFRVPNDTHQRSAINGQPSKTLSSRRRSKIHPQLSTPKKNTHTHDVMKENTAQTLQAHGHRTCGAQASAEQRTSIHTRRSDDEHRQGPTRTPRGVRASITQRTSLRPYTETARRTSTSLYKTSCSEHHPGPIYTGIARRMSTSPLTLQ